MAQPDEGRMQPPSMHPRAPKSTTKASIESMYKPFVGLGLHGQQYALKVAIFLLFAVLPFTLPMYWPNQLVPSLQTYIPPHLQQWFLRFKQTKSSGEEDIRLSPEAVLKACPMHQYTTSIISLSPLVVYISNFTSLPEAEELIDIGSPDFESSYISGSRGKNTLAIGRTSTSAPLPLEHPLVSCILDRARTFMGSMLLPHEPFSVPQLVRYFPGQKYDLHADFWPKHQVMKDGSARLFNRAASFFVYLRDNCTGGYTYFPRVEPTGTSAANPASDEDLEKWYGDTVARGEKDGKELGLKFKPIKGNAIFWVNLDERGEGDRRVVHAGLPVEEGEKIGLNLWPRKFFGWEGRDKEDKKEEGKKRWNGKWRE